MHAPHFHRLRLERFPRGIDNAHIDVSVSSELINASIALVEAIVREDVQRYFWKQPLKAPNVEAVDVFRDTYVELSRAVVSEARTLARPERVQLYQLSVFKLLFALVDRQLSALHKELDESRAQPARQVSGQSLELHEKSVILVRYEDAIRYRAASDLIRVVMRIENSVLRKMRKTVLGTSWPVSEDMLSNPILQLGGVGTADDFIGYWPYLLYDGDAEKLNQCILEELSPWLPDMVELSGDDDETLDKTPRIRRDQGGLRGYVDIERRVQCLIGAGELESDMLHAFDHAEDVEALLGGDSDEWPNAESWNEPRFERTQRELVSKLGRAFKRAGIKHRIEASYLLTDVYAEFGVSGSAAWVFDYLTGNIKRKELMRRLENALGIKDPDSAVIRLDQLIKKHKPLGRRAQQRLIVRCVRDFMHYRYQLKLAYWMFQGMDGLRLLNGVRECELSRANSLLQTFSSDAADGDANRRVVGHVIIKADVRGSTKITSEMRAQNLNPAAYFSRNLYDPISELVKEFNGEKLFVEGDAVILMILQYESGVHGHLAVARACGLARKILQVVDAKNAESRRLGLPELELGLGIAYSDEAPTYLYDEGHKITISPAINRADRLSSCNSQLRSLFSGQGRASRGVEVVEVLSGQMTVSSGDLVRYNVNGIELDAPAFYQLGSELKLHKVKLTNRRKSSSTLYQVGRYPDANGNAHWLVLRDAVVRLWMGNEVIQDANVESRRHFHEVVTDKKVIFAVQQKVAGKQRKPKAGTA